MLAPFPRITLLIVLCLSFLTQSNAEYTAKLKFGEMQLPSGVVIRGDEAQSSAESFKRLLRENYTGQMASTRLLEALKLTQASEEFTQKFELLTAQSNRTTQSVCDEYVSSNLRFLNGPMPPNLKRFVIHVAQQGETHTCEYDIKGMELLHHDGSSVQDSGSTLQSVQSGTSALLILPLSKQRRLDIRFAVSDVLISVPFSLSEAARLDHFLIAAAQQLYSMDDYRDSIIRFVAVQEYGSTGDFLLPARRVMAFRNGSERIFLVDDIILKLMMLKPAGTSEQKVTEFVLIQTHNLRLADAAAAGKGVEAFSGDTSDVFQDANEVFDSLGRYAADAFHVSLALVYYRTNVPGSSVNLDIPVKFELEGDKWRMTSKIR